MKSARAFAFLHTDRYPSPVVVAALPRRRRIRCPRPSPGRDVTRAGSSSLAPRSSHRPRTERTNRERGERTGLFRVVVPIARRASLVVARTSERVHDDVRSVRSARGSRDERGASDEDPARVTSRPGLGRGRNDADIDDDDDGRGRRRRRRRGIPVGVKAKARALFIASRRRRVVFVGMGDGGWVGRTRP